MRRKIEEYIRVRLLVLKKAYETINPELCTGNFLWMIANEFYQVKCYRLADDLWKRSQKWHDKHNGCNWGIE